MIKSTCMGYEISDYADMWRLFVHENDKSPKDLFELLTFWEKKPRRTPRDQIALAMKLSEAHEKVKTTDEVFKMVERFLNKFYATLQPPDNH